jgi:hypothetical protein
MAMKLIDKPKVKSIYLDHYAPAGAKVLSTRPWAISARIKSGIDKMPHDFDKIFIHIPDNITRINPQYLQELFENVLNELGWENFTKKFVFIISNRTRIEVNLAEAAGRILDSSSVHSNQIVTNVDEFEFCHAQ